MLRTLVLFALIFPKVASGQERPAIGLRDRIGLGISFGSPTAVWADAAIMQWQEARLEVEGSFGAGVASWGIGEGYSADFRLDLPVTNDGRNDALLLSPRVGFFEIVGEPAHSSGWFALKFTPYETVGALVVSFGMTWEHEYDSWSLETSIVPGEAYALSGRSSGDSPADGDFSFQLYLKATARF